MLTEKFIVVVEGFGYLSYYHEEGEWYLGDNKDNAYRFNSTRELHRVFDELYLTVLYGHEEFFTETLYVLE